MTPISPELFNLNKVMWTAIVFWLAFILIPFAVMLRDVAWAYFQRNYRPRPYQIAQEIQKFRIPDHRPNQEWFKKAVQKVNEVSLSVNESSRKEEA